MLFPKVLIIFSDEYDIIFQSIKDILVPIITPSYREFHRASSDKKSLIQKFEIQKIMPKILRHSLFLPRIHSKVETGNRSASFSFYFLFQTKSKYEMKKIYMYVLLTMQFLITKQIKCLGYLCAG